MPAPHTRAARPDESGQTLALGVLFFAVLLGFMAVVIDGGMYLKQRRDMQGVADSASVAAAQELQQSQSAATLEARDYVELHNIDDGGTLQEILFNDAAAGCLPDDYDDGTSGLVCVRTNTTGDTAFGGILGIDSPNIGAVSVARLQMMGPAMGMLPMAFMRDKFELGEQAEVVFEKAGGKKGAGTGGSANHGTIAPWTSSSECTTAARGEDLRDLIIGTYGEGGDQACASELGSVVDADPGHSTGQVRGGFENRIGGDAFSFEEVFELDTDTDTWTVLEPNSPRIGVVPVVENAHDGTNNWPNGRAAGGIKILGYMLVYIGNRDASGYPASTDGKSVYVTPIRAVMPNELMRGPNGPSFIDYDDSLPAPVVHRLVG